MCAGTELGIHIQAIDDRKPTQAELSKPIWFGQVAVGAQQQHVVRLHNSTALPMPFCWQQTDQPVMQGVCHLCVLQQNHRPVMPSLHHMPQWAATRPACHAWCMPRVSSAAKSLPCDAGSTSHASTGSNQTSLSCKRCVMPMRVATGISACTARPGPLFSPTGPLPRVLGEAKP